MATITIRMDDQLKKKAELMFEDMGLNMTTAFTIFTKAVVRQGKIPFEITADPFLSDENMERLRRAARDMDAGKGVEHDLLEAD